MGQQLWVWLCWETTFRWKNSPTFVEGAPASRELGCWQWPSVCGTDPTIPRGTGSTERTTSVAHYVAQFAEHDQLQPQGQTCDSADSDPLCGGPRRFCYLAWNGSWWVNLVSLKHTPICKHCWFNQGFHNMSIRAVTNSFSALCVFAMMLPSACGFFRQAKRAGIVPWHDDDDDHSGDEVMGPSVAKQVRVLDPEHAMDNATYQDEKHPFTALPPGWDISLSVTIGFSIRVKPPTTTAGKILQHCKARVKRNTPEKNTKKLSWLMFSKITLLRVTPTMTCQDVC